MNDGDKARCTILTVSLRMSMAFERLRAYGLHAVLVIERQMIR